MSSIEVIINGREKDLDGFGIRRVLPYSTHQMVGPFVFFDHMGPAILKPGHGLNVRPHPHIGLATVTYLFEGEIHHRDSLGSDQLIRPGDINWMTAGKGIVHSERSPENAQARGGPVHGIQCWVALPNGHEDTNPSFHHYSSRDIPEFGHSGCKIKLLVGSAFNYKSPVKTHSELFYFEASIPKSTHLKFPAEGREAAVYVVKGKIKIEDRIIEPFTMAVAKTHQDLEIEATEEALVLFLGGKSVGPRFLYWNFVASSQARLEQAKLEWVNGPITGGRFQPVPGDQAEFIPLPEERLQV